LEPGGTGTAEHRLIEALARRTGDGSLPGARTDGHRVALAIEGGGMRGTVSAGMALAVHELGLLPAFDAVYGASAGAISAAWLLSSRPEGLRGWTDRRFAKALIRKRNLLRGRPLVDVEQLIEVVYLRDFPLDFASVLANPAEIHPLATDLRTGAPADLHDTLTDETRLRLALRASAALPVLAGGPITIGDGDYYDAGLAESIPFRQALRDGATHVLVLRSRPGVVRPEADAPPSLGSRLIARTALRAQTPDLRAAYLNRTARLADDDRRLAAYQRDTAATPEAVLSIQPDAAVPSVGRLETDSALLTDAFEAGRAAVVTQIGSRLSEPA
jgi:predicted patatin/cPLA2 family phospholipase